MLVWMTMMAALAAEPELPAELAPWAPWVLARHPDRTCPVDASGAVCVWPGQLVVDATAAGATLSLDVTVDRALDVALPGGPGAWPLDLRVDGKAAAVLDKGSVPTVALTRGAHRLTWHTSWARLPQTLPVPADVGRVALVLEGAPVATPALEQGALRLGAGATDAAREDRVELEVARKVTDGVPVQVSTQVTVRVSGRARELPLGAVLVPGTHAVSLTADLPARLDGEGALTLQVRPGTFKVTVDAIHDGPVASLAKPGAAAPWPAQETWAVATDDRVRSVTLSGPPGVDASRTTLPAEWSTLPTFIVDAATPLAFEELRRGEPEPAPNQLALTRELWLDADGAAFTVRDTFHGEMRRGWRLDTADGVELGHATAVGEDQVVTTWEGRPGVELRSAATAVVAESRLGGSRGPAAIGWATDVSSLSAQLHVQPGWRLLGALGVDDVSGVDAWSLFDLFFVLVVTMAVARTLNTKWAFVAALGLTLARHEPGAPTWSWLLLPATVALVQALPEGVGRTVAHGLRAIVALVLLVVLSMFAYTQLRVGLFPALDDGAGGGNFLTAESRAYDSYQALELVAPSAGADGDMVKSKDRYLSSQRDPSEVVQTGPGVPTWSWRTYHLSWSGPVTQDHHMRLFLIGPWGNLLLAVLRVTLLGALALALTGVHRIPWSTLGRTTPAVAALVALGLLSPPAEAAPDPAILTELETRLTAAPTCRPACVSVSDGTLTVAEDTLTLTVQVSAGEASSWPVPGPTGTWVPREVRLDGAVTTALARQADGFLHARVPEGVHTLSVTGALPASDAVAIQLGLAPHHLATRLDGWTASGVRADGTTDPTVQLVRAEQRAADDATTTRLAPWVEVHRYLDLGLPWRVRTTLRRVGPAVDPVALRVPLVAGESITTPGLEPTDGAVLITLGRDETERTWEATLDVTPQVVLTAPTGVAWTEVWTVSCSPIFHCAHEGPAPLSHVDDDVWAPVWRVWPGESVTLSVARPEAVAGSTTTIERARLDWDGGARLAVATLTLDVRSSQGGTQTLTLPEGAQLQSVQVDGTSRPIQLRDDHTLPLPLQPGAHTFVVTWQQPHAPAWVDTVPAIGLGGPAVNATVHLTYPDGRWLLALRGPTWGPVTQWWSFIVLVLLAAPLLARLPLTPLGVRGWVLLGLGMTQVPIPLVLFVALTFVAIGARAAFPPRHQVLLIGAQLALAGMILATLGILYYAVHSGLLFEPDFQIAGNSSSRWEGLSWFADRVDGTLPQPTIVSVPLLAWRVAMLVWALWLARSVISWARWTWTCVNTGGLLSPSATQP